jgi:hypothetical protein
MKSSKSSSLSNLSSRLIRATALGLMCIAVVWAGSLALSSCATSPAGVQREAKLYTTTSNAVYAIKQITSELPPPAGSVFEGLVAVAGAGLALWSAHLHRTIVVLKNGASSTPPGNAVAPTAPSPPAT